MTRRDRLETTYNQSQLIVNSDFRSISIQAVVFPTFTNREEQFNLDSTEDANHVSLCDRAGPPVAPFARSRRQVSSVETCGVMVRRDERRRKHSHPPSTNGGAEWGTLLGSNSNVDESIDSFDAPLRHGVELVRLASVAALGGFARVYDTGVASFAVSQMSTEFGFGVWVEICFLIVFATGASIGAAFGGVASDAHGRKRVVFVADALYIISACLVFNTSAIGNQSVELIVIGTARLIAGVATGATNVNTPVYLAELSSVHFRGAVIATNTVMSALGWLAAGIATSNVYFDWRTLLSMTAVPAAVQCTLMFAMPESPKWLFHKGLKKQAMDIARRAGVDLVDMEEVVGGVERFDSTQQDNQTRGDAYEENESDTDKDKTVEDVPFALNRNRKMFSWVRKKFKLIKNVALRSDLRTRLQITMVLLVIQQVSGRRVVASYAKHLAQAAGIADSASFFQIQIAIAFVCVIGSVLGAFSVDVLGRRTVLITSLIGCIATLSCISITFYDLENGSSSAPVAEVGVGVCAAANSCRECLNLNCGFCAAGGEFSAPGRCLAGGLDGPIFTPLEDTTEKHRKAHITHCDDVWHSVECPSRFGLYVLVAQTVFSFAWHFGVECVPWIVAVESFPVGCVGSACGIAACASILTDLFVTLALPYLFNTFGLAVVFSTTFIICKIATAWITVSVPETLGKTPEEIAVRARHQRKFGVWAEGDVPRL